MKTIEQKAEAYDKAIDRVKKLKENPQTVEYSPKDVDTICDYIFPELKKEQRIDDETLRKNLIKAFNTVGGEHWGGLKVREILTWLKKKDEQKPQGKTALEAIKEEVDNQNCIKPDDKVDSRFQVGEWITNGEYTWKIVDIKPLDYILQSQSGNIVDDSISYVDEHFHSFTVKDAKEGDVLMAGDVIFIFNKIHGAWINCHCSLHKDGSFYNEDYDLMHIKYSKEVYPATKEQHDLLFQKMNEAGYEWDLEKKESKKINFTNTPFMIEMKRDEQKHTDNVELKFHKGDWIVFNGLILYIEEVVKGFYRTISTDGIYSSYDWNIDNSARLWTLQDARDCDVLYAKDRYCYFKEYLFMFSSLTEDNVISTHFCYDVFHGTIDKKLTRFGREEDFMSVTPATKKQRELLFQKMKEVGYELDAERKKSKLLMSNGGDFLPEVKESEDERIRKELIEHIKANKEVGFVLFKKFSPNDIIAWLEKQGRENYNPYKVIIESIAEMCERYSHTMDWKDFYDNVKVKCKDAIEYDKANSGEKDEQNPIDKAEPKFKHGQWIVWQNKCYKVNYNGCGYELIDQNGLRTSLEYGTVDKSAHLWTIDDAKDGDILIDKSNNRECPFIFKETKPSNIKTDVLNPLTVLGYCGIGGAVLFTKSSGWGDTANCTYYPATKEQRTSLLKAMDEAGYTFDFDSDKKELKKIEKKPYYRLVKPSDQYEGLTDFERTLADICKGWIGKECEWEEYIKDNADVLLKIAAKKFNSVQDVPLSPAWSEEDEYNFNIIYHLLDLKKEMYKKQENQEEFNRYNVLCKWLKSLKDRYTWKPSEGQMEAMENLIININRNSLLLDNYTQSNIRLLCDNLRRLVIIR